MIRGRSRLGVLLALVFAGPAAGGLGQEAPAERSGIVVRVTVGLVQVDAVVTDQEGRLVTDLTSADFVVREGGQPREITHVSYVDLGPVATLAAVRPEPASTLAPAPARAPSVPGPRAGGRLVTIVVDDLDVSLEGLSRVRDVLHRYVATRLAPGDRVAILRTGGGTAVMEQFTSDVARLQAAIDGLRYNYEGMAGVGGPEAVETQMPFGGGPAGGSPSGRQTADHGKQLERFRREMLEVGTLGALRRIVRGLAPLPGRKPVIVFSEGFKINRGAHGLTEPYLRDLTDEANRASVSLYTINARGLETGAPSAADNLTYLGSDVVIGGADVIRGISRDRANERFAAEDSLWYLASRTGGLMVKSSNDPGRGLDRVLADQAGYYLIGYAPPSSFFDTTSGRPRFHRIQIAVRRPGLQVRSRAGFYGVPDRETTGDSSRGGRLAAALVSPFAAADLGLRLQTLFVDDEKSGPTLRALLRIDGRDLTFVERPGGGWQVVLDVAAVTYAANGAAVDRKDQTFTVGTPSTERPGPDTAFFYTVDLPVAKPGAYQFRVVVQDTASERLGAASQVVAVPELKTGELALSSLLIAGPGDSAAAGGSDAAQALVGRVRPGDSFDYAFQILNAGLDPATGRPRLQTQVRLWHGGRAVYEGAPTTLSVATSSAERVAAGGNLNLGAGIEPGDYGLEVTVTDLAAPAARRVATQWARLEVVP